ncbi:4Fe-4S ferredoxin N-terminal domain-containing protein [Haladaptatus sp. NG-WS-4]
MSQPLPRVPDVGHLDEMVDAETVDPVEELEKTEYSTDLGLAMAEDAKRVSRGEMTGDEYWEKYDEAAAAEFGDAYSRDAESSHRPASRGPDRLPRSSREPPVYRRVDGHRRRGDRERRRGRRHEVGDGHRPREVRRM